MPSESPVLRRPDGAWWIAPSVRGVAIDSRLVEPGFIFVAVPGQATDGHEFAQEAVARGALAVVVERSVGVLSAPVVMVPSSRVAAAELAAEIYGHPGQDLAVTGVTGTNGKTSVVFWLASLLERSGHPTGMLSSVVNWMGDGHRGSSLTTPSAPDVQQSLAQMRDNGMTHAVVEVSSHGLVQHRVHGIPFRVGVLTNITREHLDYHGTMDEYVAAKSILFTELLAPDGLAVFNADDPHSQTVASQWRGRRLSFGLARGDLRAHILREEPWRTTVRVQFGEDRWEIVLPFPGRYNIYNVLAAVGAAIGNGSSPDVVMGQVAELPQVPGRLEVAAQGDGVVVLVDYAHTPDGLTQVLQTVRRLVGSERHIWLVFGARGGRDVGKRPIMGQIAARLADRVVLTADSPHEEPVQGIITEVEAGIREAGGTPYAVEPDRGTAIGLAVADAAPGDVVLITGRGPETTQEFGHTVVTLIDADAARAAMRRRLNAAEEASHAAREHHHPHV
jgi:UDP-N-acetylmuramoyl-L-alanyl-D-glutamate--2,6-diaminopimelate ligase